MHNFSVPGQSRHNPPRMFVMSGKYFHRTVALTRALQDVCTREQNWGCGAYCAPFRAAPWGLTFWYCRCKALTAQTQTLPNATVTELSRSGLLQVGCSIPTQRQSTIHDFQAPEKNPAQKGGFPQQLFFCLKKRHDFSYRKASSLGGRQILYIPHPHPSKYPPRTGGAYKRGEVYKSPAAGGGGSKYTPPSP